MVTRMLDEMKNNLRVLESQKNMMAKQWASYKKIDDESIRKDAEELRKMLLSLERQINSMKKKIEIYESLK